MVNVGSILTHWISIGVTDGVTVQALLDAGHSEEAIIEAVWKVEEARKKYPEPTVPESHCGLMW